MPFNRTIASAFVNDLDGVLTAFDRVIGLDRLRFVHLNDSMFACGQHRDRHAAIGHGYIGLDAFKRIVRHPVLRDLPFCLETPHEKLSEYAEEIDLVRSLYEENDADEPQGKEGKE